VLDQLTERVTSKMCMREMMAADGAERSERESETKFSSEVSAAVLMLVIGADLI